MGLELLRALRTNIIRHGLCRCLFQPLTVVRPDIFLLRLLFVAIAQAKRVVVRDGAWVDRREGLPFARFPSPCRGAT